MSLRTPNEVKTLPAYTLADTADYVGTTPETLRRWFRGRPASAEGASRRKAAAPILPTEAGPREPLSFLDLIEAHVLFSIRNAYRFPMSRVRIAMEYLAEQAEGDLRLLAHRDFCHDQRDLFLGRDKELLSLSERGQLVDRTILASGLHQIVYGGDGFADEFFPRLGKSEQRVLALNPSLNFGRLCIARLGVSAEVLAHRYEAGEKMAEIVEDYDATTEEVAEAIRWHGRLAA